MTDLRQAAQQALEALEFILDFSRIGGSYQEYGRHKHPRWVKTENAITALRTALAQEHALYELARLGQEIEQAKPVATQDSTYWHGEAERYASNTEYWRKRCKAAEQQAAPFSPEAINTTQTAWKMGYEAAKAEQQAEPVARVIDNGTAEGTTEWIPFTNRVEPLETGDLLYTAPPQQQAVFDCPRCGHVCSQRPWVGLTEEDFSAINQSCLTKLQAAASAESILMEKNT